MHQRLLVDAEIDEDVLMMKLKDCIEVAINAGRSIDVVALQRMSKELEESGLDAKATIGRVARDIQYITTCLCQQLLCNTKIGRVALGVFNFFEISGSFSMTGTIVSRVRRGLMKIGTLPDAGMLSKRSDIRETNFPALFYHLASIIRWSEGKSV